MGCLYLMGLLYQAKKPAKGFLFDRSPVGYLLGQASWPFLIINKKDLNDKQAALTLLIWTYQEATTQNKLRDADIEHILSVYESITRKASIQKLYQWMRFVKNDYNRSIDPQICRHLTPDSLMKVSGRFPKSLCE